MKISVCHSDWKGQLTRKKNGRGLFVVMTEAGRIVVTETSAPSQFTGTVPGRREADHSARRLVAGALCGTEGTCRRRAHLRHTFRSQLVMRGAAMRAVQELVGYQDLTMTQRYSHLSPAALVDTIRLLQSRAVEPEREEILETAESKVPGFDPIPARRRRDGCG